MRKLIKIVLVSFLVIASTVVLFAFAALIGTVWIKPEPARSAEGAGQREIFVLSNGFHTDIVLPVSAVFDDEGLPVPEQDMPAGFSGVEYLAIGWGSKAAYTNIGPLSDLTLGLAVKALAFDRSVMHVLPFYGRPVETEGVYRLSVTAEAYDRLLKFIVATFDFDGDGEARLLPGVTQGFGDVFYHARPRFSAFYGCNAWVGEALREAGVPMGRWTPFAQSVEWALNRSQ